MADALKIPDPPSEVSSHKGEDPAGQRWVDGATHLRKVAGWTLLAFAALGAGFVVSLPLVGLDDVTWPSATAAVATSGGLLLVGGIAMAIWATVEVLLPRTGLLSELGEMEEAYTLERFELYGGLADTSFELANRWAFVHESLALARLRAAGEPPEASGPATGPWSRLVPALEVQFKELDEAGTRAVRIAAYRKVEKVARWSRRAILVAIGVAALGALLFYATVTADADDEPASPAASPALPFSLPAVGTLQLSDERLAAIAGLVPADCAGRLEPSGTVVVVSGAGTDASPFVVAVPASEGCPGYRFQLSGSEVVVADQVALQPTTTVKGSTSGASLNRWVEFTVIVGLGALLLFLSWCLALGGRPHDPLNDPPSAG